jgi:hypothetical protein
LPAVSGAVILDRMSKASRILNTIEQGNAQQLLPLVYDELRPVAQAKMEGYSNEEIARQRG